MTGVRPRVRHVKTPPQRAWGGGEPAGPAELREGGVGRQAWLTWAWWPAGRGAGLDFILVAVGSHWKGANRGRSGPASAGSGWRRQHEPRARVGGQCRGRRWLGAAQQGVSGQG